MKNKKEPAPSPSRFFCFPFFLSPSIFFVVVVVVVFRMIHYDRAHYLPDGTFVALDFRKRQVNVYFHVVDFHFRETFTKLLERKNYTSVKDAKEGFNEVCSRRMHEQTSKFITPQMKPKF